MTIDELKNRLEEERQKVPLNQITLSGTFLQSENISSLFLTYFKEDKLILDNVFEINDPIENELNIDDVQITLFNLINSKATISVFVDDSGHIDISLRLILPKEWTFPKSFPTMESDTFTDWFVSDGYLILSSFDGIDELLNVEIQKGLNVVGMVGFNGSLQKIASLLGDTVDFKLSGLFTSVSPDESLITLEIPDCSFINLSLTNGFMSFDTYRPEDLVDEEDGEVYQYPEDFVATDIEMGGKVSIGSVQVDLTSEVSEFADSLSLNGDFNNLMLPGLDDLVDLLGPGENLLEALEALPEEFSDFQNLLALKEATFYFDLEPANISNAIAKVESTKSYSLIPDLDIFTLEALNFQWFVFDPLGDAKVRVGCSGILQITEEIGLELQLDVPGLEIYAGLTEESVIDIESLIDAFLPSLDWLPSYSITMLGLTARINEKAYTLSMFINGSWDFQIFDTTISIGDLWINAAFDEQQASSSSCSLEGILILGGVEVFMETQTVNDEPSGGWEFEGYTYDGQEIPIGTLIDDLANMFVEDIEAPAAISDLVLSFIKVSFNTSSSNFFFYLECDAQFPIDDDHTADIKITIDIKNIDNVYEYNFGGHLVLGDLTFDLHFDKQNDSSSLIATFREEGGTSINIKDLVSQISPDEIAQYVPEDLTLNLIDALFVYSDTNFILGLDVATGLNLSNLPLVGQNFTDDETIGVDDLQLLAVSGTFVKTQVDELNTWLEGIKPLPSREISSGFNISAVMKFGSDEHLLEMPVPNETNNGNTTTSTTVTQSNNPETPAPTTSSASATWFELQKGFYPVYFERIGLQYEDDALWFLLDASLTMESLTISMDGLAFGSPLNKFEPQFRLDGIGLEYTDTSLEISGAFLRISNQYGEEYDGAAVLKTSGYTLSAIGSYADIEGHPSLFAYAMLNKPMGGPTFFFVTGLAAGFGYNRSITMPDIDDVADFPLIKEALEPTVDADDLVGAMELMQPYMHPAVGENFLMLGIKFNSYKLIDSFALFTFILSDHPVVELVGLSQLILPTPQGGTAGTAESQVAPLAVVKLALKGSFDPLGGSLELKGQLTDDSYLLSKDCHLTGGFAFYAWFSGQHSGDFVATVGGYHPSFQVPDHYPSVPRLGFNWALSDKIDIKGEAYCALTPHAMMAGGTLEATYEDGDLKAWYNVGANFLINWQPYHYEADMHINIGASYKVDYLVGSSTVTADLGAQLNIWGPKFSGKAKIDWSIISFTIKFGSDAKPDTEHIDWSTFKNAFLPDEVCSISPRSGLENMDYSHSSPIWIINPREFALTTDSFIPIKVAKAPDSSVDDDAISEYIVPNCSVNDEANSDESDYWGDGVTIDSNSIAINSMGLDEQSLALNEQSLTSDYWIEIQRVEPNGEWRNVEYDFEFISITKDVPVGLWGTSGKANINDDSLVKNALTGFEIISNPPKQINTAIINRSDLLYNIDGKSENYFWNDIASFIATGENKEERKADIENTLVDNVVNNVRKNLLTTLGMQNADSDLNIDIVSDFLVVPQIEQSNENENVNNNVV